MHVTVHILGSGTSTGVPMLACRCPTCTSQDPRDTRWRASVLLSWNGRRTVIDTTPEFRLQMLRARADTLDAVLLTHSHADHINGFDDLRQFRFGSPDPVPVYGSPETLDWIRHHFSYIWRAPCQGGGLPKVDLRPLTGPVELHGLHIVPIPVRHGALTVYGYRVGGFAYLSDVSAIPPAAAALLRGLDVLVLDAVRYRPHDTHFHLEQAVAVARELGPARTLFTHLNHDFLHARLAAELPPGMAPAWDGLEFTVHA